MLPDMAECAAHGVDYLPCVWPGFSWTNSEKNFSTEKVEVKRNSLPPPPPFHSAWRFDAFQSDPPPKRLLPLEPAQQRPPKRLCNDALWRE